MTPDWLIVLDRSVTSQPHFPWGTDLPATRFSGGCFQAIKPALDISSLLRPSAMSPSSSRKSNSEIKEIRIINKKIV